MQGLWIGPQRMFPILPSPTLCPSEKDVFPIPRNVPYVPTQLFTQFLVLFPCSHPFSFLSTSSVFITFLPLFYPSVFIFSPLNVISQWETYLHYIIPYVPTNVIICPPPPQVVSWLLCRIFPLLVWARPCWTRTPAVPSAGRISSSRNRWGCPKFQSL